LAPTAALAPFIAHYWQVQWDVADAFTAETLPHPTVHVVFEQSVERGERAEVAGVHTARFVRTLVASGSVFGIKFRPAAFASLYAGSVSHLSDRTLAIGEVLGSTGDALAQSIFAESSIEGRCAAAERFLLSRVRRLSNRAEQLRDLVERVAISRELLRSEQLAIALGSDSRSLQRLFRRYVGASPKWVIQRYRLHEAAERLKASCCVDLAELALELGYADQSHFTRDFTKLIGRTPASFRDSEAG
jgi:AraC-like DNA-binding protein